MQVTFYHRRPQEGEFSIERLFKDIRSALCSTIECNVAVSRFKSKGILRRVYNIVEAALWQGDVNHITGDVHFLTYLLRKKKTLLIIHDLLSLERLKGLRRLVFFFFWYWLPVKRSAVVSVVSESTKKELLRYLKCDPNRIRVIHDCVSDDFKPCPKEFNTAKPIILVMRAEKRKNLSRVVEAVKEIPCHLRIIGELDHEQLSLLRASAIEYSSVSNISDEQILKEYQQCDMLVFASTYEGFGLPILEAQATGRPVVTSNIMSMPEVAGDAACLVNPLDVSSIRKGIVGVINDPLYRRELIERGFENVQRFRPEKIANQYLDIYREIQRANGTATL